MGSFVFDFSDEEVKADEAAKPESYMMTGISRHQANLRTKNTAPDNRYIWIHGIPPILC